VHQRSAIWALPATAADFGSSFGSLGSSRAVPHYGRGKAPTAFPLVGGLSSVPAVLHGAPLAGRDQAHTHVQDRKVGRPATRPITVGAVTTSGLAGLAKAFLAVC
jgi:hypothetical protein